VIKKSPGFAHGFFFIRRNVDPRMKEAIMEAGRFVGQDTEGKQLLTLFRLDGVEPFRPEHMKPSMDLLNDHDALLRKRLRKVTLQHR
jgi:ABC-type phosphate/phosphonate transport system substrate-binding protein